jgi:hypothetical protein
MEYDIRSCDKIYYLLIYIYIYIYKEKKEKKGSIYYLRPKSDLPQFLDIVIKPYSAGLLPR